MLSEQILRATSPETAGRWVILHESGWADTEVAADTAEVRLEP